MTKKEAAPGTAGDHVARVDTVLDASPEKVWRALTEPELAKKVMFGADLKTDWKVGSEITWTGDWQGERFEDKGEVLEFDPPRTLRTTHFSPLTGKPDIPENYHEVAFVLDEHPGGGTRVTITQTNNPSEDAAEHSAANWRMALDNLKRVVGREAD